MAELSLQHVDKIYDNNVQAVFDFNLDVKDNSAILHPPIYVSCCIKTGL